jgi:hypothetical protein
LVSSAKISSNIQTLQLLGARAVAVNSVESLPAEERFWIQYTIRLKWFPNFYNPPINRTNAPTKYMIRSICKISCHGVHSIFILAKVDTTYINKLVVADPFKDDLTKNGIRIRKTGAKNKAKV